MNKLRKQSSTTYPLFFLMVDSTDHVTGKTGLSPTVTISKNGASFASPSGAITEVGNGLYKIAGNATDSNTVGELWIHATGTGADPTDTSYTVVAYDPFDSVRLGLTSLPNAAAEAAGGLYTRGSGAGQINQPANGQIDANAVKIGGTVQTARDIGASVLLSPGTGTGQVSISSGVVSSNITQIDGQATSGNNATLKLKSLDIQSDSYLVNAVNVVGGINPNSGQRGGNGIMVVGGNGDFHGYGIYVAPSPTGSGSSPAVLLDGSVGGCYGLQITGKSVPPVLLQRLDSGSVVIQTYSSSYATGDIDANISGDLLGNVASLGTQAKADVNAEVKDVLENDSQAEPASPPSSTSSLRDKIGWLFTLWRNKRTQSSTQEKVYADNGTTVIGTSAKSDSSGTFTRGEFQ